MTRPLTRTSMESTGSGHRAQRVREVRMLTPESSTATGKPARARVKRTDGARSGGGGAGPGGDAREFSLTAEHVAHRHYAVGDLPALFHRRSVGMHPAHVRRAAAVGDAHELHDRYRARPELPQEAAVHRAPPRARVPILSHAEARRVVPILSHGVLRERELRLVRALHVRARRVVDDVRQRGVVAERELDASRRDLFFGNE